MLEIALRFKKIRDDKNMTITAVAAEIGEKRQRLQDIELGNQKIPQDVIVKYIEYFNIDANWLLTGKGEMYLTESETDDYEQLGLEITEMYKKFHRNQQKEIYAEFKEKKRLNEIESALAVLQNLVDEIKESRGKKTAL